MDRIFGGLLTWLSGQDVTLGTVSPSIGSPQVQLGWSGRDVFGRERRAAHHPGRRAAGPVRYLAGTEWRLLGTYNALDAQRVFRFGHALGRRFLRVPIPAADIERFRTALLGQDQRPARAAARRDRGDLHCAPDEFDDDAGARAVPADGRLHRGGCRYRRRAADHRQPRRRASCSPRPTSSTSARGFARWRTSWRVGPRDRRPGTTRSASPSGSGSSR